MKTDRVAGRSLVAAWLLGLAVTLIGAAPVEGNPRAVFPVESLGARGVNVIALQHLLRAHGATLAVSGVYGSASQLAVADFQQRQGMEGDGVVDEATWRVLLPVLDNGARSEAVIAAQKLLAKKRRITLEASGTFDGPTRTAVLDFQRHMGLQETGRLTLNTWRNLLWHYVYPNFASAPLCDYHSGNGKAANWGTSATIAQVETAARLFRQRTGLRTSYGEASFEHGGRIPGHATHRVGLDADFGLIRKDGRHCRRLGLDYRDAQYDRARTRMLIGAIYDAAPGRVKLIYFNDPVLVREGLVVRHPNHSHHLHVRYCEVGHAEARYRCPVPSLESGAELDAMLAPELAGAATLAPPWGFGAHLAEMRY